MTQWIVFVVGSLLLIAISWKSLRNPRSHGFYRFFAWETILALFVINMKFWFYQPFAWNQIIAWSLLLLSLIPLALGIHSLRTRGEPVEQRQGDPSLLAFEKTTTLVTSGIALASAATFFLVATARADERECIQFFGAQYPEYMQKTKRFIPYIF
jgi:hypothetical protein